MTFEERIDRLTDRHEALAQTVEMIAHNQRDHDERHRQNEELLRRNQEMQRTNQEMLAQVIESMHGLARIAEIHERRISDIEDGRT